MSTKKSYQLIEVATTDCHWGASTSVEASRSHRRRGSDGGTESAGVAQIEMASFLLTATVGAVLNAAAFTGGSYLAHYLSGKDQDEEIKRHDLAMEQYEQDYNKWKASMARAEQWKEEQEQNKDQAARKFKSTDGAFRYYAQTHPDEDLTEPQFSIITNHQRSREAVKCFSRE